MTSNPKNTNGLLVDPVSNCNDFDRTDEELEAWFVFCVMVAGHQAEQTAQKLQTFFEPLISANELIDHLGLRPFTPFEWLRLVRSQGRMDTELRRARTGCYAKLTKVFSEVLDMGLNGLTLRLVGIPELISIPGIGLKTASFFIMSTRENVRMAALDTHVLKLLRLPLAASYLTSEGLSTANVPRSTPTNPKLYEKLERVMLTISDDTGLNPVQFDFVVWKLFREKKPHEIPADDLDAFVDLALRNTRERPEVPSGTPVAP